MNQFCANFYPNNKLVIKFKTSSSSTVSEGKYFPNLFASNELVLLQDFSHWQQNSIFTDDQTSELDELVSG